MRECEPVLRLPDPCLVILVGVAGAGKSTWAATWFPAPSIVSSDDLRAVVGRHRHDLQATKDALEVLDLVVTKRLRRGLLTVIDSTSLEPAVRARYRALADDGRGAVPRRRSSTRRSARREPATVTDPRPCRRRW